MDIKHICFISEGYPTENYPFFTFVRQLVCSIADSGVKCSVISPQSITKNIIRKKESRAEYWIDKTTKGSDIYVYQPKCLSTSNLTIGNLKISQFLFERAVIKEFIKRELKPDILYGHFWHCGIIAAKIKDQYDVPVIVASGEARIDVHEVYPSKVLNRYLKKIDGAVCVSSKNLNESMKLGLLKAENMRVIPNAIDSSKFYKINKSEARDLLGFEKDDFIVAYTGYFIHRKGALRLAEAVKTLEDVKTIYIGSGNMIPTGPNILFCDKLPHNEIVNYLNAADVFVLPTLAEGCCNAIIEAMACGLPIISSDKEFNDDILDESNAIRVDSMSIEAITKAILYIKNNPVIREEMSKASLSKATALDIDNRAHKVFEFIKECMESENGL